VAAPSSAATRGLRLGTPRELRAAPTRSHLSDGRCVGWVGPVAPGTSTVVDGELEVRPPVHLARRFGDHDFFARWTRAECAAKLLDVPIAVWWHRHGLEVPAELGLSLVTLRPTHLDPRLVVTVGTGLLDAFGGYAVVRERARSTTSAPTSETAAVTRTARFQPSTRPAGVVAAAITDTTVTPRADPT
jgi:hypothetical protein